MRTDVRIGLAIGGILFIVVLSYVLFFTGPKAKQVSDADRKATPAVKPADSERAATHEDSGEANTGASNPSSNNDVTISPPPSAFSEPIARTQTPAPLPAPLPNTDAAAATPSPSPAPAPAAGNDWANWLDHGEGGVARTVTPTTPSAPVTPATGTDNVVAPPDAGILATTTPPTTTTPPPAGPSKTHQVKQGESYWSIAEAEYGSGAYMSHLIKANPKYPPSKLRSGISIVIPPKDQVVRSTGGATSPVAAGPTTRPFDAVKQYKVKSGDSLYSISKALYGKTDRVNKIYEMNRDTIGPDPHVLKLGTVLQLPEPPKSAAAASGPVADIAH